MSDALAEWVEATFGHHPRDPALFRRALTHGSREDEPSYERLEFLGDRVLGLCMAEWLYHLFPDEEEGMLSRRINMLVSGATCAAVGREIGLPERLRLGKGAPATVKDSDNLLGDVVEALLAALYLEAGLDTARRWVRARWEGRVHSKASATKHPKAALQEWAEAHGRGLPIYAARTEEANGAPVHTVAVRVGTAEREAAAPTKREAETLAAAALLRALLAEAPAKRRRPASARKPVTGRARA